MEETSYNGGKRRRSNTTTTNLETFGLENLPLDIIYDILSRLPFSSLVKFKYVCRAWRSLTQDPKFLTFYLSSTLTKNDPCLILHCDLPIRNQLYFIDFAAPNQEKEKVKRINAPFWSILPEFDVVGSCNGLLCLADSLYNDYLYIYNPFTRNYTQLPKSLNYPDQEVVFGFGFNPKSNQYKVIKIVYYRGGNGGGSGGFARARRRVIYTQSEVQILTLGNSSEWRSLGKIGYQLVRRPAEALVNGRLHWVSRPRRYNPVRRLISLDLSDEQFREVPKPECGGLSRCYHVVVLKGCLSAAVYCNYGRLEIWMMKEYNVKESWVKEYSIGTYMPKGLKQNLDRPLKIWKNYSLLNGGKVVRVLGILKNGEILLEYKSRVLVCYDPNLGKFKDLSLQGIPKWFQTIVHVGSFNWIDSAIDY